MIFYYAQVNEEKICFSVSQLAGEVMREDMIRLEDYDVSLLGKRWDGENWLDVNEEEPEQEGDSEAE